MGGGGSESLSGDLSDDLSSSSSSTSSDDLDSPHQQAGDRLSAVRSLKDAIVSHKPGDWTELTGGTTADDYDTSGTTTLLLVGPRGSGKSSLINRITRVFDSDPFAPDRAQVSYNLSDGTLFLQEYMIPRCSDSLCLYDTRSLSESTTENIEMIKSWMTEGVSHGEMVVRRSDNLPLRQRISILTRHRQFSPCMKKNVNFVMFVVDGVSVLKSMDGDDATYNKMVAKCFNYPYLSFQDDKPVVVMTHGDELACHERALVCAHLGEILGIPPKQIYDIPDTCDAQTELTILDMLRYSIEHADKNLTFRQSYLSQARRSFSSTIGNSYFDRWGAISVLFVIYLILVILLFRALDEPVCCKTSTKVSMFLGLEGIVTLLSFIW